ncbi:SDR family oxidoreductase [Allomuricauda sp. F6463D]|uniref:SDR family oxidoreductase n=1 Tax=Allomuricauda sp. F6463D TaxID=2926409 RepID=UPI001FF50F8D|nr:SDR family oxidoreductase [Muricauda sp. F6463D]MCK0159159.1 SDR family oxidoreductase [Muricauda sp. F6463D]
MTPKTEVQKQQPGNQHQMEQQPVTIHEGYKGSGKLQDKVALITGGDSGIGRSVALHYAREGANVAIVYYNEEMDAEKTKEMIQEEQRKCFLIQGDIKDQHFCKEAVEQTVEHFGLLNVLVNNAAMQFPEESIEDIGFNQLKTTFETNVFSFFYFTQSALKYLEEGDAIINTASITAYRGKATLIDYASTKGAIVSFTRSLSTNLSNQGIRVNAVAPGPIWTPLIPASFDEKNVKEFGENVPLGRMGQPAEVGPAYVFLASEDSSYMTGQVMHINGGEIIGG